MKAQAAVALLVLILVAMAGAGCMTTQSGENGVAFFGDTDEARVSEMYYPGSAPMGTPAPVVAQGGGSADWGVSLDSDQKIIRTASINLEVKDVPASLDELKALATANGGYVGSMSVNTQSGDRLYAVLTMRVPAASFDRALEEITALGTLKSQSLQAEDVTEEYVDLQARRSALANQLSQYQRILEKAENVSDILEVQVQIERVQVEIDRIDGRLKYLNNRVDYATITVSVREPVPVGTGNGFSITSVINDGIAGFLGVTAAIVIVLISVLPLIVIGLIIYGVYRWRQGRKKETSREKATEEKKPGE